ncbi:hypothetical protein N7510_008945 [Penicillium lagena]|uniref:uncharacterized protein n=1 Tax=Penicillium lagena TaxID=94218 RepID=UPI002540EC41|nr:uncharacterized protein N7510_008945 [Penicillium lagena]KAJ5606164.1 hypothetical protein N7510_008945 [Penicillium lagena]
MGREDQAEEREVLDSIFPDEITGEFCSGSGYFLISLALTENPRADVSEHAYRVSISLDPPEFDGEEAEQPVIYLEVSYPEDYPDVAPDLNISAPPNAPKNDRIDVQEDRERLLEALQETIEENMGMAMVFTLVSALKESAELLMSERANAVRALQQMAAAQAEEEENRKFQGTPVNRETFLEWNARFKQEMEDEEQRKREEKEVEDKKKKASAREEKKLTGRQLWERGLAGKADYDEEEDEETVSAGVDKLKVAS